MCQVIRVRYDFCHNSQNVQIATFVVNSWELVKNPFVEKCHVFSVCHGELSLLVTLNDLFSPSSIDPLGLCVNNYLYLFFRCLPNGLSTLSSVTTAPGEGGTDSGDSEKAQEKRKSDIFWVPAEAIWRTRLKKRHFLLKKQAL